MSLPQTLEIDFTPFRKNHPMEYCICAIIPADHDPNYVPCSATKQPDGTWLYVMPIGYCRGDIPHFGQQRIDQLRRDASNWNWDFVAIAEVN